MFLKKYLMPSEEWRRLRWGIVDVRAEFYFRPIISCIRVSHMRKGGCGYLPPLAIPRPNPPLTNRNLLWHQHTVLVNYLPRINSSLQRVQGYLIANHTGEVMVDLR